MKITYIYHACFLIEYGGKKILFDPFFDEKRIRNHSELADIDYVLLSHGHHDHTGGLSAVANNEPTVYAIVELASFLAQDGYRTVGVNFGGTVQLFDGCSATLVRADHTSGADGEYLGEAAGWILRCGEKTVYYSGDTAVFGDMALIQELYRPTVGLVCVGGHYTADIDAMAYACNRFFHFDTVIPMHYNTFSAIRCNPEDFVAKTKNVRVMNLGESIEL